MNAMSTRSVSSTRSACSPTAAWVRPRTRPPSSCRETDRHGREPGGDRHRVGHHDQLAVGRQLGRDARGGGARVEQHAGAAAGKELGGGRGDGVLVLGAGGLALADAGLDEVQRTDRHGAAVHPSHDAGLVEDGEVAAHRLGGDVVGLRQLGHRGAALRDHQRGDRLLTLFGIHDAPFVWELTRI